MIPENEPKSKTNRQMVAEFSGLPESELVSVLDQENDWFFWSGEREFDICFDLEYNRYVRELTK